MPSFRIEPPTRQPTTTEMEATTSDDPDEEQSVEVAQLRNMILVASEDWIRSKAKTAFKTLCRQCLGDPDDTTLQEIAVRAREIALEEYRDLVVEPVSEMRKKFLVEEADKWIQNETLSRASNVSARVERAASNATLPPRMFRHSSLGGDSIHSLSSRLESEPPLRRSFSSPRGSSVAPELLLSPTSTHPPSRKRAREIENTSSFLEYATSAKRNKRYEREETVDTVITNRRNRSPSTSRPQSSDGPAKVKVRCPFQDHPRLMSTGTHKCNGKYAGLSNLRTHLRGTLGAYICLRCDKLYKSSNLLKLHIETCPLPERDHRRSDQSVQNRKELMVDKVPLEKIIEIVKSECSLMQGADSQIGCDCDHHDDGTAAVEYDVPRTLMNSNTLDLLRVSQESFVWGDGNMGHWVPSSQMQEIRNQIIGMEHVGGFGMDFSGETGGGIGLGMGFEGFSEL